jgi:hypothetical protein
MFISMPLVAAPAINARARAGCPGQTKAGTCPVLEVSGTIDAGTASLGPAFDLIVRPAALTRAETTGNATLVAYNADGGVVVTFPFTAFGPYRIDVPLLPALAQSVRVVRVVTASATAEERPTVHGDVNAEAIAPDDGNVIFAWNAQAFPSVRIESDGDAKPTYASGTSTYEQLTLKTAARRLTVDFSDGVRSETRTFAVFGR